MNRSTNINVYEVLQESKVNGPGVRSVVWVQGCCFNCPGCANHAAREDKINTLISPKELLSLLPLDNIEGITISGGEPFLQPEPLLELARLAKNAGLTIMIYTGFTIEELKNSGDAFVIGLLDIIDILIDGRYVKDIPPSNIWSGSGNQRVHFLSDAYSDMSNEIRSDARYREAHIDKNGDIIITGF